MTDAFIQIPGSPEYLQSYRNTKVINGQSIPVDSEAVTLTNPDGTLWTNTSFEVDAGNTKFYTSSDGTTTFTGAWYDTRQSFDATKSRIAAQQLVFASNVASGLGGTFVFQYSDDGVTPTVNESRVVTDFSTVRDLTLQNFGLYFRIIWTPSRALTGGEFISITTREWRITPPPFVRLANQQIEEGNAAMPSQFAYLKTFDERTGKSVNLRPSRTGALRVEDEDADYTHSGSLFVEGVRDDIQVNFSSQDPNDGTILVNTSTGGTAGFTGGGQVEFATPAVSGNTCIFRTVKTATYEPGHAIRGDQTIEIVVPPTGNATVFWGYSNGTEAIGYLLRSTGLSIIRKTNGVIANEVVQANWNIDNCNGQNPSQFFFNNLPQALNTLKNNYYAVKFEWLGADGPEYLIKPPSNNPALLTVHQEEFSNNNTGPTVQTPSLPLAIEINNGTAASAIRVRCGSWRGGIHTSEVQIPGLPNWKTQQITVGTSPVKLDNTGKLNTRTSVEILSYATNTNNQRVFIGPDNTVTASPGANPGRPIENGESFRMDLNAAGTIWAVGSTAGMVVQFTQLGT